MFVLYSFFLYFCNWNGRQSLLQFNVFMKKSINNKVREYEICEEEYSDLMQEFQIPMYFQTYTELQDKNTIKVLSLFSGCGGMDLGFEGDFIAPRLSYKGPDDLDVVTGGFPCQSFSVAGKRKGFDSDI